MRRVPRPLAALAAGGVSLAIAWGVGPHSAPPLYDSGPIVAEQYRYLHPPPGYPATQPPGRVDTTLNLQGGQSPPIAETTDEQPAQAQLLAAQQTLDLPPKTTAVRVQVTPVEPPAVAPAGGTLDGDVYRFSITGVPGGAPLALRAGQPVTVVLRGPAGVANPVLELWDGSGWARLDTSPLGSSPDSYAANITRFGDIALVAPPQTAPSASGGGGGPAGIIVAAGIVAVVIVAAAVVLALRRRG